MDRQEFTLSDGRLSANVVCDPSGKQINITFAVSDMQSGKPVIDMDKYYNAVKHQETIQGILQQISGQADIGKGEMHRDGTITMQARFTHEQEYERAVAILRDLRLTPRTPTEPPPAIDDTNPTLLEKLGDAYKAHPQDIPDVTPATRPETNRTLLFLQKLIRAENEAEVRGSLKVWQLEGQQTGLNATVFPVDKALLTGLEKDDGTSMIAIRITPGIDTHNARATTYHNTHEIEKRLMARGLLLHSSEIFHGSSLDNQRRSTEGHHDTGVILINAQPGPLEALEQANEVLRDIQQHEHQVIRLKLGTRSRGEDHHFHGKVTTIALRQPDPLEIALESHLRAAADSGLISLNGSQEDIANWIRNLAMDLHDMRSPPRRGGAERE